MRKLLTIIIPAYNMEHYLERCVSSLMVESDLREMLDILIVNDGSRDKTSELGHRLEAAHPSVIRVIDKPNGNYGSCVNRGLKEAMGEYVRVLDADDYFDVSAFERYLKFLAGLDVNNPVDLVLTDHDKRSDKGDVLSYRPYNLPVHETFGIEALLPIKESVGMLAMTYRLDLLREMHYVQTEGISYTDNELVILPMAYVRKIAYCPECVYHYSIGREGQTISQTASLRSVEMFSTLFTNLAEKWKATCLSNNLPKSNREFVEGYQRHLIGYVYSGIIAGSKLHEVRHCFSMWDNVVQTNFPDLHEPVGLAKTLRKAKKCILLFYIPLCAHRIIVAVKRTIKRLLRK